MKTFLSFLSRSLPQTTRGLATRCLLVVAAAFLGHAAAHAADNPLLVVEQGAHSAPVRRIDVDAARGLAVTASDDRTARVWDLASGELRQILRPLAFGAEGGRLYGAAIHPTRNVVAVGGTTGGEGRAHLIYLFDLDSGALLRSIDARAGDVRKLAWSKDGSLLLAAYAGANGFRAFTLDGAMVLEQKLAAPAFGIATAANGMAAVVSLDGSLRTYRASIGAILPLATLSLGTRRAAGVSFSPDGKRLAVAFADSVAAAANAGVRSHEPIEIFDTETGTSVAKLPVIPIFGGDLRVLTWSADGRSIYAGGTAYAQDLSFPIVQYEVDARKITSITAVAGDSVTDLVALPGGGVAYSSFDGSWGLLSEGRIGQRVAPKFTAVRGDAAEDLEVDVGARKLRWGMKSAGGGLGFEIHNRRLGARPASALRVPETSFGLFSRPTEWNLARGTPMVAGKPLPLAADERSRALVVIRATRSAVIGTNRALYKLDEKGDIQWRSAVDTEIRALNASEDGRLIVSAMTDGTVRWWRASDGVQLLTLLADAQGRWVLWTPSGYYDASAGADRLVGWAVGNSQQRAMDFFSLNRFRDRFNRPDLIDALLDTLDERLAFDKLGARDQAASDQATRDAQAREQDAVAAARASAEAAELSRRAALREAEVRLAADQAAREASIKAEAARLAEARRVAAQAQAKQQAERDAADREAAVRVAEAREAAAREAASRKAAREAELNMARLAAEQEAAARLAAARDLAAKEAAREAAAREAAVNERKALAALKALEIPPALTAPEAKRVKLATPEVTLQFAVSSSGSAAGLQVEVRVNGRPALPADLVLPKSLDGSARGFAKVQVAEGESLVEILARNQYGVSEPLSFKIERAISVLPPPAAALAKAPSTVVGDLYVLAIGISDYVRAEYRLGLPAKDATDFGNAMQQQQGKQYRKVVVRTLTNRDATRANIAKEFETLKQSVGPNDVAMLFMAGHGLNDAAGQYYFLPADANHERLASTALPQAAIVSTLSKIRGKTLLFLDTCFAGNSLGALRQSGRQTEKMMNDLSSSENGVVVFASSTGQEESEEKDEWGNGAFTKALIEGLAGKADFTRTGRVTYAALNLFISEEVSRITQGRQRPVFISPRGIPDFALVRL